MNEMFYESIDSTSSEIQLKVESTSLVGSGEQIVIGTMIYRVQCFWFVIVPYLDMSVNGTMPEKEVATITYAPRFQDNHKPLASKLTFLYNIQTYTYFFSLRWDNKCRHNSISASGKCSSDEVLW